MSTIQMFSTDLYRVVSLSTTPATVLGEFPLNCSGRQKAEELVNELKAKADEEAREAGLPIPSEVAAEWEKYNSLVDRAVDTYDAEMRSLGFLLAGDSSWTLSSEEDGTRDTSFTIFVGCDRTVTNWDSCVALFSKDSDGEWSNIGDQSTFYLQLKGEFHSPVEAAKKAVAWLRSSLSNLIGDLEDQQH